MHQDARAALCKGNMLPLTPGWCEQCGRASLEPEHHSHWHLPCATSALWSTSLFSSSSSSGETLGNALPGLTVMCSFFIICQNSNLPNIFLLYRKTSTTSGTKSMLRDVPQAAKHWNLLYSVLTLHKTSSMHRPKHKLRAQPSLVSLRNTFPPGTG